MSQSMKAILKMDSRPGLVQKKDIPMPQITAPDDVLIKVKATAICGTDLAIYNSSKSLMHRMANAFPVITGHEFCGHVVAFGSGVSHLKEGEYVSAEMHIVCGQCYNCRHGNGHVCLNTVIKGVDGDGCFAEYVKVPASNIVLLDSSIPYEIAAYMDALGNAVHTVNSVEIAARRVAILGCGSIGLMAIAVARHCGAEEILATDTNDKYLEMAKAMGADRIFNVRNSNEHQEFIEAARSDSARQGVDVVLEISGNPSALADALSVVRMGGDISLLGLPNTNIQIDVADDIIFKGINIHGIIGRRMFDTWYRMIAYIKSGLREKLMQLVTHTFSLEDFQQGFDIKNRGEAIKVVFYPNG
ncbi:L-threonine 3-dehydrogenase [candidate division KSB1 bacterium]|nr:L-threonine 3-dehydrogenase [candidate division KSB1 bacterium]